MTAHTVTDPGELGALFERDRYTHLYGLADLEEPFWSNSTWFIEGSAAVGLVSVGEDWMAGYAMSSMHPRETLNLLTGIQSALPTETWLTGPVGLTDHLATKRRIVPKGIHHRMILKGVPEPHDRRVVALGPDDAEALMDLHHADPDSAFMLPTMLEDLHFRGVWEGDTLVASGGTHAVSDRYGVAAIGALFTRPSHRGRGLGEAVMSALSASLADRYKTVGLNVAESNLTGTPAL